MLRNNKILRQITAVAFWVTVWFIVAVIVDNKLLVASPIDTLVALITLLGETKFYISVAGSLTRIMAGFIIGLAVATAFAVLAYKSDFAGDMIAPFISLCKAVPVAAFAVILIIWWGPHNLSLLISMIIVMPVVYANLLEGLKSTDEKQLQMAKVFQIPFKNKMLYIYRPALKPYILSAIKSGVGMSWKAGVAAEVIGLTSNSIGGQLYTSKVYFETAEVFAWAVVTIALSFVMEKVFLVLAKALMEYRCKCALKKPVKKVTADIVIRNMYKSFGSNIIYNNYSHVFKQGEKYTIRDKSGSGKTTLFNIIAGLENPDSGSIICNGTVSMVFQEDRLCEGYTAVENVALTGIGEDRARQALELVLDKESLDKPCQELSGGMKRRVAIVRALEYDSDIVLLDEPYTGMDEATIDNVKKYIESKTKSKTVIMATHIL